MKSLFLGLAAILIISLATSSQAQTTTTEDVHVVTAEKDSAGAKVLDTHTTTRIEEIMARDNMIVVNPLKFLLFYNIGYYRRLSEHFAVGGSIQTPTPKDMSGIGFLAEGRWYPGNHNLRGFYVAPNFSFNSISVPDNAYYDTNGNRVNSGGNNQLTATSLGLMIGWQWFPGDDFALGLGIGIDNYWLSGSSNGTFDGISSMNGKVPAFRLDIGYGW